MDPLRIAVRAAFAFFFILVLLRASGKRTVAEGNAMDFVLALIFGDMVDDLLWAEVPGSHFVIVIGTMFALRLVAGQVAWRVRAASR